MPDEHRTRLIFALAILLPAVGLLALAVGIGAFNGMVNDLVGAVIEKRP